MLNTIFIATFMLFCSGNVVGQLPYKVGPPCSKCASGKGWCYKNLCSKYTVMRASRRDSNQRRKRERWLPAHKRRKFVNWRNDRNHTTISSQQNPRLIILKSPRNLSRIRNEFSITFYFVYFQESAKISAQNVERRSPEACVSQKETWWKNTVLKCAIFVVSYRMILDSWIHLRLELHQYVCLNFDVIGSALVLVSVSWRLGLFLAL